MKFRNFSEEEAAEYLRPAFTVVLVLTIFISISLGLLVSMILLLFNCPGWIVILLSIIITFYIFVSFLRKGVQSIKSAEGKLVKCEECNEVRNIDDIEEKKQKRHCRGCFHEISS